MKFTYHLNYTKLTKTILVFLSIICVFAALLYYDGFENTDIKAEYGLILGNKVELDGRLSTRLAARTLAGSDLYQQGRVEKLIVSGGLGKEGYKEAEVMADFLLKQGVSSNDIIIDNNGYTTHLSAINAANLLTLDSSIIAISQHYHVSRSKLALRNAGFSKVYGYYPNYYEWRDIYASSRELAAWVKYYLLSL